MTYIILFICIITLIFLYNKNRSLRFLIKVTKTEKDKEGYQSKLNLIDMGMVVILIISLMLITKLFTGS